jgi:hypothetical protein
LHRVKNSIVGRVQKLGSVITLLFPRKNSNILADSDEKRWQATFYKKNLAKKVIGSAVD